MKNPSIYYYVFHYTCIETAAIPSPEVKVNSKDGINENKYVERIYNFKRKKCECGENCVPHCLYEPNRDWLGKERKDDGYDRVVH